MKRILFCCLVLMISEIANTQILWDGEAGDNQWSTASNWSGNIVPGPGDNVILNNSIVGGSYIVNLPGGATTVTVSSITITPALSQTIQLVLPNTNTSIPGLEVTSSGDALVLNNNAILQNSSGASVAGLPIIVSNTSGVFKINNGATYIHNTVRQHAGLVDKLSASPGTEDGIFKFDVPGGGSYTVSIANRIFGHLVFSAEASGTILYTGAATTPLTINGDFDMLPNTVFSYGSNTNIILIKKNCNISSTAIFNISNGSGNATINLQGNLINSGTVTESGSSTNSIFRFNGTSAQTLTSTGSITNNVIVDINNSSGVMLLSPLVLPGILQLSVGNLSIGNFDLTVAGSVTGGASTNYIQTNGTGLFRLNGIAASSTNFPIGASSYNPLVISNPGIATDYSVRVEDGFPMTIFDPTRAVNRTWFVRSSTTQQANITYGYTIPADVGSNFNSSLPLEAAVYIADWSIYQMNVVPTGGLFYTASTTINSLDAGSLRGLVLGNPTAVLPIDFFITCNAQKQNNDALIKWSVAQTDNVIAFEIEKATGNNNYRYLSTVTVSDSLLNYTFTDKNIDKGTNFYRIKVIRQSGGVRYSNVVAVVKAGNDMLLTGIIPNPVLASAKFVISSGKKRQMTFTIYDVSGKAVKQWNTTINDGNTIIEKDLYDLSPGNYHLAGTSNDYKIITQFVKF